MKIKDLKIGYRLAIGFSMAILLTVLISILAYNKISLVNESTKDLAQNNLVSVQLLGEYRAALNQIRRFELQHALTDSEDDQKRFEEEMATSWQSLSDAWRKYDQTPTTAEEDALKVKIEELRSKYQSDQAPLLEVSRRSSGLTPELHSALKRSGQAFTDILKMVKDDVQIQADQAAVNFQESQKAYEDTRLILLTATLATIAVSVAVAFYITLSITRPVASALSLSQAVAQGDLTVSIDVHSGDEVGRLCGSLADMVHRLRTIVTDVRMGVESVSTAASQIAVGNADLSQRTEEQASNLQQTAASMEQLTGTVQQTAETASTAATLSHSAQSAAVEGAQIVSEVVSTMDDIQTSSRKISDIITMIDGIAFQTNILALNAAVEAARAGEQGRGFAVVAAEVRSLAQRSAGAAKEIKHLVQQCLETIDTGADRVSKAGQTMGDIESQIVRVASFIHEISSATKEQSSGIQQVGQAVMQLDQVTQQNAALVEESAAAAESLQHQAVQLSKAVAAFRLGADELRADSTVSEHGPRVNAGRPGSRASASKPSVDLAATTNTWSSF
jgi:methyl-accepting chemotaxis protein